MEENQVNEENQDNPTQDKAAPAEAPVVETKPSLDADRLVQIVQTVVDSEVSATDRTRLLGFVLCKLCGADHGLSTATTYRLKYQAEDLGLIPVTGRRHGPRKPKDETAAQASVESVPETGTVSETAPTSTEEATNTTAWGADTAPEQNVTDSAPAPQVAGNPNFVQKYVVTVAGSRDDFSEVVNRLPSVGMAVSSANADAMTVLGYITNANLDRVRNADGVANIVPEGDVDSEPAAVASFDPDADDREKVTTPMSDNDWENG